jgi:hypothetical protein
MTTKKDICTAFFLLAAKERALFGIYGVPLTTQIMSADWKSPGLQQKIELGATSLHDFLRFEGIPFTLDNTIAVQGVSVAFRRCAL